MGDLARRWDRIYRCWNEIWAWQRVEALTTRFHSTLTMERWSTAAVIPSSEPQPFWIKITMTENFCWDFTAKHRLLIGNQRCGNRLSSDISLFTIWELHLNEETDLRHLRSPETTQYQNNAERLTDLTIAVASYDKCFSRERYYCSLIISSFFVCRHNHGRTHPPLFEFVFLFWCPPLSALPNISI